MRKNKIIICIIILFTISFLSIGFSAFNAGIFIEHIGATVRVKKDIRVTDIIISDSTKDVLTNYIDYDVNSIFSEIYLPYDDSSITYKVSITNFESTEMGIFDITGIPDNLEYSISNYVLKEKICDDDSKCNLGVTKDIYITIKYKNNIKDGDTNLHKIKLLFDFRSYHAINYENIYGVDFPTEVIDGDKLTLNLDYDDINLVLKNQMGYTYVLNTDYEYKNSILTIPNVNEEVYIEVKDKVLITNVTSGSETNENIVIKYYGNRLNSSVSLSNSISSQQTINITIYNSTNYNYVFSGISYDKYDNDNIIFSLSGLNKGDLIKKGESIKFSLIFKYIDNVNFNTENFNNILNSIIKFNFEYVTTPVLLNNMVPVIYNNNSWTKISSNSQNWHSYIDNKWANAITYNHNLAYNQVTNNTELKQFNGTSDYVILGSENRNFKNNITLMVRFKIYEYGDATQILIGNVEDAGFYIGLTSGNKIRFRHTDTSVTPNTTQTLTAKEKVELNTWYTVVVTYDGNMFKLYIDGLLVGSIEYSNGISVSTAPIAIGANPNSAGGVSGTYFKGAISEGSVMTSILTEGEIAQNYGNTIHHVPTKHNVLYYLKFDADNGVVANSAKYENQGMSFDGVDDHISVGYSLYDFKNIFSIGVRVKLSSHAKSNGETTREYSFFGNPQAGGLNLFESVNNKFAVAIYDTKTTSYITLETDFTPELNTWYTVLATYDGATLKLYINGELHKFQDVSIELTPITTPFMIGVNPNLSSSTSGHFLHGMVSDVLLVDEALTANQIKTYYSNDLKTVVSNKTLISYDLRGYEYRNDGSVIPDEMINGMWVWIPRFNAITPTKTGPISLATVSLDDKAHDAFVFSDKQIEGFWIGKFENGANVVGENYNSNILIRPNITSVVNRSIGTTFTEINNIITLGDIFGFNSTSKEIVDTHLIKNNEWAAVSYFTQSKYGLCNTGTCMNLSSNSTGITGGSDYITNVEQSTTQNIYGVYDINGGKSEFVMGNYNNTLNSLDGFTTIPSSKYLNVYNTESDYLSNNLQHALFETSELFNASTSNFVTSDNVWLTRNNLFDYNNCSGVNNTSVGSRSILVIK